MPPRRGLSWRARTREGRFRRAACAEHYRGVRGSSSLRSCEASRSLFRVDKTRSRALPWVGWTTYRFARSSRTSVGRSRHGVTSVVYTGVELLLGMGIALLLYAALRGGGCPTRSS